MNFFYHLLTVENDHQCYIYQITFYEENQVGRVSLLQKMYKGKDANKQFIEEIILSKHIESSQFR